MATDFSRRINGCLLTAGALFLACMWTSPLQAQTVKRPLADFLKEQGSGFVDAAKTQSCWTHPAPTQLGWGQGCFDAACEDVKSRGNSKNLEPFRFAMIDYTGLAAKYLLTKGIDLGTAISGQVTERALADGRALVSVDLHTRNALGWAWDAANFAGSVNSTPLSFGTRVQDLTASPLLRPSLGDSFLSITFTNTAPGARLPDLVCINAHPVDCPFIDPCPADFQIQSLQLEASISGSLHAISGLAAEGTPGQLMVRQRGMFDAGPSGTPPAPLTDAFPVESVSLKVVGQ
jgi:hypothetical protein